MEFKVNELITDEFGRPHGILAVNKPVDWTSHDVVAKLRGLLGTKRVGHAGALDPFASGVLVVLVGQATKLTDQFISTGKEYTCKILFGVQTDSADTEGEIIRTSKDVNLDHLSNTLTQFVPEYEQYVPVYSSIKVEGQKLRVLARRAQSHEVFETDEGKFVKFVMEGGEKVIALPKHTCQLPLLELLDVNLDTDLQNYGFYQNNKVALDKLSPFATADVRVACSKGTYIRTLAEDIGAALPSPAPAMLLELERTRVDRVTLEHALTMDQLIERFTPPEETSGATQEELPATPPST